MTGWRVGFIGAPTWIAQACNKIQGQITSGIGFTYNFNHFKPLENIKPLIIRLDIPFFLNRPPASDDDFRNSSSSLYV